MKIFKTWNRGTYLKGLFTLKHKNNQWAHPINFPTVFTAFGKGIKSGNWNSCTSINTPDYVINHYFDGIGNNMNDEMFDLWKYCKMLENISWKDLDNENNNISNIINLANNELLKLKTL